MSIELETVKRKIAESKAYLKDTYGIEEIALFGSLTRDDFKPDSDIDIVIELNNNKNIGMLGFARIKFYLESILQKEVDLVIKNGLKPLIKDNILKQMIIV
jgi:predicted nucleotidyltransferase